jgi:hypothetical protein
MIRPSFRHCRMHLSGSIGKTRQGRGMPRSCVDLIVAGAANFAFAAGPDKCWNQLLRHVSRAIALKFAVVAGEAWSKWGRKEAKHERGRISGAPGCA